MTALNAPRRWWSSEATAIVGVGAGLLGALLFVTISYLSPLRTDLTDLRDRLLPKQLAALEKELRDDVADVRTDLHGLGERVARIEGTLAALYRLPPTSEATE